MGSTKTVTEKTLAANRLNAKLSTGPRTARGKSNAKFNALKTGLFAEHVVIPFCDGKGYWDGDPKKQFAKLLGSLQEEHKPEGPSEVFWVELIAECMWKQRRVSRSERGLVRARTEMGSSVILGKIVDDRLYKIRVLEGFLKEIETIRADSPEICEALIPVVHLVLTGMVKIPLKTVNESSPDRATLLDQFVASLRQAKDNLERSFSDFIDQKMKADYDDARALPEEGDMDQILRYDRAMQKKFDWALQRLLESQQRRRKAPAPASGQLSADQ